MIFYNRDYLATDESNHPDYIYYSIVKGTCSYCGSDADYAEDSLGKPRFYCSGCDRYNDDLEAGFGDDDTLLIIPTGDDNLNVYF